MSYVFELLRGAIMNKGDYGKERRLVSTERGHWIPPNGFFLNLEESFLIPLSIEMVRVPLPHWSPLWLVPGFPTATFKW